MDWRIQVLLAILGSGALFGFVEFLIQRRDAKWKELKEISNCVGSLTEDVSDLKEDLHQVEEVLETKIAQHHAKLGESLEETKAVNARVRILSASDEIRHHMKHSKEWFDQLNEDITFYEHYCMGHPNFKNNKAVLAIANINRVYADALKDNDFLT